MKWTKIFKEINLNNFLKYITRTRGAKRETLREFFENLPFRFNPFDTLEYELNKFSRMHFNIYSDDKVHLYYYILAADIYVDKNVDQETLCEPNNEFTDHARFKPWRPYRLNLMNSIKTEIVKYVKFLVYSVKFVLLAGIITVIYFLISLFYIQIDITKQIAIWYLAFIMYYLLLSTFNSFLIKYKYGKYTSAIQRFWKRTGIVFWLIEGFLFLLFFYYFLNSSQEPLYMFDYSSLNQELLIQLNTTYKNLILLSLAIYLSFILLYNLNFLKFKQNIIILLVILLLIFYSLFIETYQFVYILSLYADKDWMFEDLSQIWTLEVEQNNIRVKQQYFIYCLIAKYWHFIFIFISWFFFFIKSLESKKITYTMLGYNTQNLIILYVLNCLCLIQWIKYSSKKFLEITFYWFQFQYDEKFFASLILEIFAVFMSSFKLNFNIYQKVDYLYTLSVNFLYADNFDLWKFI